MNAVRILYIEDDDVQRRELTGRLSKKQFHVTPARSGKSGIAFFKKRTFDAVLCDLHMPGKDGEAVLETVRKKDKDIPFIIMSGHGTVSKAVKTIKKGADHFILKPANVDEITLAIKQAIEKKELAASLAESRATLQMVAENVPDIIYSLNTKGEFVSLSPAVKSSMGYSIEELLGTSAFAVIHPDDRPRVMKDFGQSVRTGGTAVRIVDFRMISKTGEIRHFEVSRKLIFDGKRVVRIDGIARDDTERILLQKKLEDYSQSLEKMVQERTERLQHASRQLTALTRVSDELNKLFSEEELFDKVSTLLTQSLDFDRAYLLLADGGKFKARSWCAGRSSAKRMETFIRKVNKGSVNLPPHVSDAYKQKKTFFIPDIKADRRWPKDPNFPVQAKSVVISPIMVQRKVIGTIIGSMDERDRDMTRQDVERFEMFANMVGLALDNIRAYQSMEQKVIERTDSLRKLNEELKKKAAELEDSRIELAYANVDLLGAQEDLQAKAEEMEVLLKELFKKSKELEIVIDTDLNAILLVDNSGRVQVANRRIEEYFDARRETVIGQKFSKFVRSIKLKFEEPDKFMRLLKRLEQTPDAAEHMDVTEFYDRGISTKGDKPVILSQMSLSVADENNREVGRVWIFSDITKIKKADKQVHAIVSASPIPTIISRIKDGEILYVNKQLANLVGSAPEKLLGQATPDFYYCSEDREKMLKILRKEGSVDGFEVRIKRVNGTVIWVIFSIVVIEISGEKVILGALYDISDRKHFEEALEKERNFVSAVLDTAGALVLVMDRDGKIVRFNRTCEESSGYTFDEVRAKPFWDIFVTPEQLEEVKAHYKKLCDGDFPIMAEAYWVTKSGENRLIAWSNTCLLDVNGEVEFVVAIGIDITDQRKAEDNLKLFRELFLNANDAIVLFDAKGRFIEKNPAHKAITGYSHEDFRNHNIVEIWDKDCCTIEETLSEAGSYRGGFERRKKDGTTFILDLSVFPIKKDSGVIIGYAGIGRDITERKRAETAITARLRYEKGLAQLSQTLLTGVDSKNALPEALGYLLEAAGASRVYIFENFEHEIDGMCMRQIYEVSAPGVESQIDNPDLQHIPYDACPARWKKMLAQGEPLKGLVRDFSDEEKAILEPQGILSMLCIPIKVESEWYGYVGFDETKRERLWCDDDIRTLQTAADIIGIYIEHGKFEESLRVSEERFRSLVENAADIIYSLTPKGEFSYLSPKVKDIMGYEVSELSGKPVFDVMHPDDMEESRLWFKSELPEHEEHREGYEFRMIHKDGSTRWFRSNGSPILDENGNVMELIGVAHDITQMKAVLEEIEKANRDLRNTQAQLAQSEKMASLGTLVAGIAHEINTPIGAVNSMHDTLMRAIDKLKAQLELICEDEKLQYPSLATTLDIIDDSNKVIKQGTERVTTIVRRLRSFARLDEAELKTVDIHEGMEDTLTLIHHQIKHDITVNKNYGDIPAIPCYPGQLNQVFLNMLVNARQAIKGKGEITITTCSKDNHVFIKITDTGSGISAAHINKIFDPGFTTKGVGVGTGLGLAICYKIIEDHHGTITVESQPGKGTTFTIMLPVRLDKILKINGAQ